MEGKMELKAGENTHENVIFACFGGASNTGIVTGLASMDAVKEMGLRKLGIMCLGGLPNEIAPVLAKTKAAKKIITVDGCPFECSRKIVERAGFKPTKSIVLVRDIGMKKKSLTEDIPTGNVKPMDDYIDQADVRKAKELIVKSIQE